VVQEQEPPETPKGTWTQADIEEPKVMQLEHSDKKKE